MKLQAGTKMCLSTSFLKCSLRFVFKNTRLWKRSRFDFSATKKSCEDFKSVEFIVASPDLSTTLLFELLQDYNSQELINGNFNRASTSCECGSKKEIEVFY
eukprot:snap_masked-scaffold_37-processed-gene-2.69-mRNA-1 protein AED:1.00 eAED:1.00 QI:0/-1/0/0/-1/1/1/0/100